MRNTRLLAILLAALMLLSGTAAFATNDAVNPKGVFPIVKEGNEVELSLFVASTTLATDFDAANNAYTAWVEEQTGLKLNIITAPASDVETKLGMMLSTGDYPDIIFTDKLTAAASSMYAAEGIFIPLDALYDEYGDAMQTQYENYPLSWDGGEDGEGRLVCITNINDCLHCNVCGGRAWYQFSFMKAYQEATGAEVPDTVAELKDYLTWVRDNDVNGNGDAGDEIPLATADLDVFRRWLTNSFLPYPQDGYAVVDGKIEAQYTKDAFRDAIAYAADLYKEGLILPETFSLTMEDFHRIGEADTSVLAVNVAAWPNDAYEKFGPSERYFYNFLLPTLEGPNGVKYTYQTGATNSYYRYAYITDACKNPDAAFRLIDFMKTFEGTMNGYIGLKGECWDDPDEGMPGLNGKPALYKLLVNYGTQPLNAGWDQRNADYRSSDFRLGEQADGIDEIFEFLQTGDSEILAKVKGLASFNEASNYYWAENQVEFFLPQDFIPPAMIFSEDEANTIADIEAVLDVYVDQAFVEFITGTKDINDDAAWAEYVGACEGMGVGTLCDIYTSKL